MSANITGNPTGVVAPMVVPPTPGTAPVVVVPSDGDAANAASVAQPPQQLANHIAYLMNQAVWNATLPSTGSNLPQMRFKDAAGNGRYVIDHNGLPTGGRISRYTYEWDLAPAASGSPWTNTLGTAAAIAVQGPTAAYNDRFLQFTPSSTSGAANYALTQSPTLIFANTAGMSAALEFEVGFNAAAAGATSNVSWFLGLDSGTDPVNDVTQVTLYKKYNDANYRVLTGATIQVVATTSTPPTVGAVPTDRIRIEIQGSASAYGAYQARIFVNETLLSTVVAGNLPGAVALKLSFGCANEGGAPSGSPLAYMGPVMLTWNRFTSGPNL